MPTVYYYYFFFNQTFFLCFAWGNLNCDSVILYWILSALKINHLSMLRVPMKLLALKY